METTPQWRFGVLLTGLFLFAAVLAQAGDLDTMGVTQLRASHPNLTGSGIIVAQPEAVSIGTDGFEVNPAAVGQPMSLFDWISTNGDFTTFPNDAGIESDHADVVGDSLYASWAGIAPGVAHVDNYEADYFIQYVVQNSVSMRSQVANQSFAFFTGPPDQQGIDSFYDDYIATYGTIFASAPNNGDSVGPPGTAYNCLGVGAYGVGAVVTDGPTLDNGRSKPDIVAPGVETSFTTPYVAGAAAILLQAANAGYAGANTTAAADLRTIKAILLNSALKPFDWTHTSTAPLDTRYGAGVLNLNYAYQQFSAGQFGATSEATVASGGSHPPISTGTPIASLQGWNYATANIVPLRDTVDHYLFNTTSNTTLTATIDWERHYQQTGINNLSLFLYNATNATLISSSVSSVDNVQHIYVPHLPKGKYDLQVVTYYANSVSLSETYALAFQFFPMTPPALSITESSTNEVITWPYSPTVYNLQETGSLTPANWTNVTAEEWITNTTVWTSVPNSGSAAFFRLAR